MDMKEYDVTLLKWAEEEASAARYCARRDCWGWR